MRRLVVFINKFLNNNIVVQNVPPIQQVPVTPMTQPVQIMQKVVEDEPLVLVVEAEPQAESSAQSEPTAKSTVETEPQAELVTQTDQEIEVNAEEQSTL